MLEHSVGCFEEVRRECIDLNPGVKKDSRMELSISPVPRVFGVLDARVRCDRN